VCLVDLDAERLGQQRQLALAGEGGEAAAHRDGAEHRWVGPVDPGALERLLQDPAVE
jgi:hypothetical protein